MKRTTRWAIGAALALAVNPLGAQEEIATPILTSASNFRDLAGISLSNGGTGLVNTSHHSGVMRTGVFYRSDYLALSDPDFRTISTLGIGRVIDLRTPSEYTTMIDRLPPGARDLHVNLYGTWNTPPGGNYTDPLPVAVKYMQSSYQLFITDPVQRSGFHTVMITLANDRFPDLYHCSGGKDRTGWTSAILESIAGVSQTTIMNDYLATNRYTATFINTTLREVMASGMGANPESTVALLGVQSSYLQAALDQVIASYGSMDAYLKQGLGLSQADIYVLRAKMVYYGTLPGQTGLTGNAASGAALLNELQNSPLSGRYTDYNYYLQSAIDAGTLGGVEAEVGGQVYADTASYLLRQPQQIDAAIAPYTKGRDLPNGKSNFWLAGFGGGLWSAARDGAARSAEYSAGSVLGATYRFNQQASAVLGLGYNWGSIGSANATATVDTVLVTGGGRYAFADLDDGPFVEARAEAGWVGYQGKRPLGGGLGTATGDTTGAVYSGRADVGDVIRWAPVTLTLQTGARVAGVSLHGFNESGSDLALDVHGIHQAFPSLWAGLEVSLDPHPMGTWTLVPTVVLSYERILGHSQVASTGSLDGYTVRQSSAYDSRDLVVAGVSVTARHRGFSLMAQANAIVGSGANSIGVSGQLSIGSRF